MNKYYRFLRQKCNEIEQLLKPYTILRNIFTPNYFKEILNQIDNMEKNHQSGPIHSMFIFFRYDSENNYSQTKMLEKYLYYIFNHPSIKRKHKNNISKDLTRQNCLETLFEISILGNLLYQLPNNKVTLYPKTISGKNVDAMVVLINRPIYVEVTVLGESGCDKKDRESRAQAGIDHYIGWRNIKYDGMRFTRKIYDKSVKFKPNQPNVLMISVFDFFPDEYEVKWATNNGNFSSTNIGLILQFGRAKIENKFFKNCNPSCHLAEEEKDMLIELLDGKNFLPLKY